MKCKANQMKANLYSNVYGMKRCPELPALEYFHFYV